MFNIKENTMKKSIFIVLFSLGALTAFAQEETDQLQEEATEQIAGAQDNYSEITMDELPDNVTAAVEQNYPNATISKAYSNEDNNFKLEVAMEDDTLATLYLDSEGNFIDGK